MVCQKDQGTKDSVITSMINSSMMDLKIFNQPLLHKPQSSIGIKYPTLRDHPLHTGYLWLKGRQADDGAEGFWRIHDNLYDLTDFVNDHPGGSDWLRMTKGTDITEAFESHHLSDYPSSLLAKYFVRKASSPRNFPFTFKEEGFYKTLRRRVIEELKNVPESAALRSKLLTDLLLLAYLAASLLAVWYGSFVMGLISGVLLALTGIAAHNFFHQKDNFRMYYFDFTLMDYREWRISHVLSHHLYTNTVNDLEISTLEPFLQYMPTPKIFIFAYISWLYSPIVHCFLFIGHLVRNAIQQIVIGEGLERELILPFVVPIVLSYVSGKSIWFTILMYLWIQIVGSLYFGFVGLNAGHHHPDNFHDGDAYSPEGDMDWGMFQVGAVMDRKDITGSHFLVLTSFGDHALHHMFPTIDHGKLEYLYPVFMKTCQEFGVKWKLESQLEAIKGQFRQLAKTEPKKATKKTSSK